jgi:hypothetical protein
MQIFFLEMMGGEREDERTSIRWGHWAGKPRSATRDTTSASWAQVTLLDGWESASMEGMSLVQRTSLS